VVGWSRRDRLDEVARELLGAGWCIDSQLEITVCNGQCDGEEWLAVAVMASDLSVAARHSTSLNFERGVAKTFRTTDR
jgi:hypothetical protein